MGQNVNAKDVTLDTVLGRIHVRTAGEGEATVFWPSLLMTGAMWSAQAKYFADRYRVVLIDPPGHGTSQRLTAPFSFEAVSYTHLTLPTILLV